MSQQLHSPHEEVLLHSLQWQGGTNDCAPYTIATILSAFSGLDIEGSSIAMQMNRPVWKGIFPMVRRIPDWATFPWGIADVFREHGFKAGWGFFYSPYKLRRSIENGNLPIPVISSWRPLWAHVMALIAWDLEKGWGFANTQINSHQIFWVSHDRFIKLWNSTARLMIEVFLP